MLLLEVISPMEETTWDEVVDKEDGALMLEATPVTDSDPDCNNGGGEVERDNSSLSGSPEVTFSAGKEIPTEEGNDAAGAVTAVDSNTSFPLIATDGKSGIAWLKTGGAVLGPSVI